MRRIIVTPSGDVEASSLCIEASSLCIEERRAYVEPTSSLYVEASRPGLSVGRFVRMYAPNGGYSRTQHTKEMHIPIL